jgi:hypothetical protein
MPLDHDNSLVDLDGSIRHFSTKAFAKLAADPNRCFVCGKPSSMQVFNNEHIIPDWVLRRFSMHSRVIFMPNGCQYMYGRYKLRCCADCNSILGSGLETPVSKLLSGSFEEVKVKLQDSDLALLYRWMCLLFIKSHLKDREIRIDPDTSKKSESVGQLYDWEGLHHIHAVARSIQSRASIDTSVVGTTLIFGMRESKEAFDFFDISDHSTICIRLGLIGIASVLNDCGGVSHLVNEYFSRISGPLSSIQLREVAARLAYGNTLLGNRPHFWSELDRGNLTIRSQPANPWPMSPINRVELGEILVAACAPLLRKSQTPEIEEKIFRLAKVEVQFLYNDDGSFIVSDDEAS